MVDRSRLFYLRLGRIEDLPMLGTSYFRIMQAIEEEKDISEIAQWAREDPFLTVNTLKFVNSPMFMSVRNKAISNIEEAIVRLGVIDFKRLVVTFNIITTIKKQRLSIDFIGFWKHALLVANLYPKLLGRLSDKEMSRKSIADFYTVALLHDIGILILDIYFPTYYQKVIEQVRENKIANIDKIEKKLLGITHEEVGSWLVKRWNLPPLFAEVVGHHHNPQKGGDYDLFQRTLRLSDEFVTSYGVCNLFEVEPNLDETIAKIHGQNASLVSLFLELKNEIEKAESLLKLID